jgi:PAS domain-containing protein
MPDNGDNVDRLKIEIDSLKSRIAELEKHQLSSEDRLKLAIIDRCPFTVWACDRNFRIVLWNSVCEQIYGHNSKEAIGADYADLFVDPVEEEQCYGLN